MFYIMNKGIHIAGYPYGYKELLAPPPTHLARDYTAPPGGGTVGDLTRWKGQAAEALKVPLYYLCNWC